ncbi:transposable element Tcb1 transposase [Trichonephila clavipes]|nr:transposable element Tcb1 transposase [Trichonephila clavipes]
MSLYAVEQFHSDGSMEAVDGGRCTSVGFVNSWTSAAPWITCKGAFIQIPLTANLRRLRLQWAHEHRARQADWHQVVFSDESSCNLWYHETRIRVRLYTGERCLPECVIERQSGLTLKVMVWGAISYHGQSNLLRIESNLNSKKYLREVLSYSPKSFPSFKAPLELSFSRIIHAHIFQRLFETSVQPNTCNFFLV